MNDQNRKLKTTERKYDLEERFVDYAVRIITLTDSIPNTRAGNHISSQLLRSGTSPAPNYGEAQSAESRKEFVHKLKIALKELRETNVWLKIIMKADVAHHQDNLNYLLNETDELISIVYKSIETAKRNLN